MNSTPLKRVPHIILSYWIIKIASTTLGETGADMFSMTWDLGYAVTIGIFLSTFLVLLAIKFSIKRYSPTAYWLVFTASAILGTALSDFIDRTLGLGYTWGALLLLGLLLITLLVWYLSEKSLSVEHISSSRAEVFYWMAFLVANTLGTAAGDYLADELELGFMVSAGIVASLLALTIVLHYFTKLPGVLLFWIAFVLTRPFGATFGDFLTKPVDEGGINLGTIWSSIVFAVIMAVALYREAKIERRIKD